MPPTILATKLYAPPPRPQGVWRAGLIERLDAGLHRRLTLISAPAGFGKTTLISAWLGASGRPAAWLALDENDSDPTCFLTYLAAALQQVVGDLGAGVWSLLGATPPPVESIVAALLNAAGAHAHPFLLVLDDYHLVDSPAVDQVLAALVAHLPPQLHLVIATREDPNLPLPRLRARDQLTELRAADLRFTPAEAAEFLNRVMGLNLAGEEVAALEARTEGWIAGLQLAALSLRGRADVGTFVQAFAGDNRYVVDYLMAEVLDRQPEAVRSFLFQTAILDRLCGPLCDAVTGRDDGDVVLDSLERANLFIVPLDDRRRWYRYHHLFADLLRQRLGKEPGFGVTLAAYHIRASQWLEDQGLEIEAFQHAAAAGDIPRAVRLAEGKGMPLLFRGAVTPVLHWLASLPGTVLDAWPVLPVMYASGLLFVGQLGEVEPKLRAAEAALAHAAPDAALDAATRDLRGHIASIRATLAVTRLDADAILAEARRALELLDPGNLPVRTAVTWMLGVAWRLLGQRAAAGQAFAEAVAASEAIGHFIITISATIGLGNIQEGDNHLQAAAQSFRRALQVAGEPPPPIACEAHLGLARVFYAWNDLEAAEQHVPRALQLAAQLPHTDRTVACQVFDARVKLAQGDRVAAAALLAQAEQAARKGHFVLRLPEIVAAQVRVLLHQGNLPAAAQLAATQGLPGSLARVRLAQGDPAGALALLEPLRQQAEAAGWEDERLQLVLLQALARYAQGEEDTALHLLAEVLAAGAPEGLVRLFLDEGPALAPLLSAAVAQGITPEYAGKLLAALPAEAPESSDHGRASSATPLVEPLSRRELEVLHLIAHGLSNQEIGARLFLALDTVKGHNRRIFEKLGVQRRTEAVAKARALQLLPPSL